MRIERGRTVEIEYELYDAVGVLVEASRDEGGPVEFVQGDEEILPGIERALEGHEKGDEVRVELGPDEAYGPHDPEGLVSVPRSELPPTADDVLQPGDFVTVVVHEDEDDDDPESGEIEMRIVSIDDDEVVLDANHPLAGQDVTFVVRVLSVR